MLTQGKTPDLVFTQFWSEYFGRCIKIGWLTPKGKEYVDKHTQYDYFVWREDKMSEVFDTLVGDDITFTFGIPEHSNKTILAKLKYKLSDIDDRINRLSNQRDDILKAIEITMDKMNKDA